MRESEVIRLGTGCKGRRAGNRRTSDSFYNAHKGSLDRFLETLKMLGVYMSMGGERVHAASHWVRLSLRVRVPCGRIGVVREVRTYA
jgi:hypothetical protein